jgi:hypothetical protein
MWLTLNLLNSDAYAYGSYATASFAIATVFSDPTINASFVG